MSAPEPRLRLLFFPGKYFAGSMAIRLHAEILDALAPYGIEATIVSRGPAEQTAPVVASVEEGRRVIRFATVTSTTDRALNFASKHALHYDFFLSGVRRLLPIVRQEPFDVAQAVMAFPFGAMLAASLQLAHRPAPLLLYLSGGDLFDVPEARYGYARFARVRWLLRYAFGQARLVRANSQTMAERARTLGCPPERLRVVPNNISVVTLPPGPIETYRPASRARVRAELGLPDGPLLLAAGRLSPIKGFEWAVRALPALVARWPDLSLLIAGPTVSGEEAYAAGLRAEAERLGVGRQLRLLGAVSQERLRELYAAADLLLVTSLFEGLNKTGIEAGANGVPGIVTTSTGLAPYVVEHNAGLTVPARDAAALAEAATRLLADAAAWQAAAAGARRMAQRFTPAAVARELVPLFVELAPADHPWRAAVARDLAAATAPLVGRAEP